MKHQQRICQWLGLPNCTHLRTFLDLPAPVRRQIYIYAGLVIGGIIHLRLCDDESDGEEQSLHFTFSVLQTCKAINREVSSIIYGENCISVDHEELDKGLVFLSRFKPDTCRRLRRLVIVISRDSRPKQSMKAQERYLQAWQHAITNILSNLEPQTLTLSLACYENDIKAIENVLQPLAAFPGVLRDCDVSLSGRSDKSLGEIARQVVYHATGKESYLGDKPFRFLELPVEIRQEILKYTDLVTPFREALWKEHRGFAVRILFQDYSAVHDPSLQHDLPSLSCQAGGDIELPPWFCNRMTCTYSSRCQCWAPPRYLFLVCRSMYADAVATFYSCNRIVVCPSRGYYYAAAIPRLRLDGSRFITRLIWPDMLSHLRSLDLVFSPFEPGNVLLPSDPAYNDWRFAIDHLKAHGNVPALTITVYMTTSVRTNGKSEFMRTVAHHNGNKPSLLRTHLSLLSPLRPLKHMKRFFVHLEWPWFWGPVAQPDKDEAHRFILEAEEWLEERVMGNNYDSHSLGKSGKTPSQWLELALLGIQDYEEEQNEEIPEEAYL